jgi:hypothetical protein
MLTRAGIGKADRIQVVGPASLAAVLWLFRHGYRQVGVMTLGRGPRDANDLILVPQTCTIEGVEDILQRGPHPREGGVLIVQTHTGPGSAADDVHLLLDRAGYRVERCLHGRHRDLHVARRRRRPIDRLAA